MSRIITYPSTVDKENYTVVMVDTNPENRSRLETYLKVCRKDYDVYLYEGQQDDLQWLSYVSGLSDAVLIDDASQVTASHSHRYGPNTDIIDPLGYFEVIDNQNV